MTRQIYAGPVAIGGGAPVSIQSMLNTRTTDVEGSLRQIRQLAAAGCEIARLAIPDMDAAHAFREICAESPLPLVADIHFDYRLAIAAAEAGASKIRINPGNIGGAERVRAVVDVCKEKHIPIRIGVNGGSLDKKLLEKYGHPTPEALVESALRECALLENYGMRDLKVALKSSSVPVTLAAYRKFADRTDYPLHIGITEAGTPRRGIVKSAVGIGSLLLAGIGDTLRVSLTAPPAEEVLTGLRILEACGLRSAEPEVVSCPTCGRTRIDLVGLADKVETFLAEIAGSGRKIQLKKIAVMGCAVNGPGEARDADLGIAGSAAGKLVIFRHGEVVGAFDPAEGFERFRSEIQKCTVAE